MRSQIISEDLAYITQQELPWEKFRNQTILITGANGFLPAYMVESLLFLNESDPTFNVRVLALVRNKEKAELRFKNYIVDTKRFSLIVNDVSDELKIDDRIDFIIHAASQASPKYYGIDPVGTLNANVLGTINLMKLAKQNDVKSFLFFSSSEVYGEVDDQYIPIKENYFGYINPTLVRSCYAESKRMGENICVSWLHQYGIKAKIVRPFHTYGPNMMLDDGRVFADFVADILYNRNIIMKSSGTARRAFCYSADAIFAYFFILLNGKDGEAYNVGNPNCDYSILELAEILVSIFPEKNLKVIHQENNTSYLQSKVQKISPDIEKIKALGWIPKYSVEEGFKRTISSYSI